MAGGADTPTGHEAASKLAQLLGQTIVHHAPWSAEIDNETKWRHTKLFMDELEAHTAGQVGPFLRRVLDATDPPPEIRSLIEEAIEPPAAFSAILEQIFLYGIVSNIIGTSVGPFLQGVTNDLNSAAVNTGIAKPTSPATIATAAARGLNLGDPPTVTMPDWAYSQAAQNGISHEDMDLLASIVGLPPALQELFELYRRGVITIDQVKVGLKEGDFRDDWVDRVVQLVHSWLSPLDFVRAAVQAQMPYADARAWAQKTGLDTETGLPMDVGDSGATADMFGLAFAIAGRPPGPEQLARMALRGIIPWDGTGTGATTFQQGVRESDVKTKWTDALRQLAEYVPPPSSVSSLLERGAITEAQAQQYWQAGGVPPELAQGYAYIATQQHVGQDKLLAKGEITTGYFDGIFDHAQALELLGLLGYSGQVADDVLAITDFRREIQAINAAVKRIEGLYAGYRLTATRAKAALEQLGLPTDQATSLLRTWEAVRVQPIRLPAPREIGRAVKAGTITTAEGLEEMHRLGYQDRDAAIMLSAYSGTAITPLPPEGTTITG